MAWPWLRLLVLVMFASVSFFGYSAEAYGWSSGVGHRPTAHRPLDAQLGIGLPVCDLRLHCDAGRADWVGHLGLCYSGRSRSVSTFVGGALVLVGIYVASRAELK